MKMEGVESSTNNKSTTNNSNNVKSSSTSGSGGANDADGLTFGPAWLRQLSSGDTSKITALPPSPGLAFQLAKHRYGREEMLAIFETIEKKLNLQSHPPVLVYEFEDLYRRETQRPILLTQPTLEEQVLKIFLLKKL
jgi:hypothetical protein